ncbi:TIGR04255 family protein [Singulisphaera acidiphila]|uniref:TIGR04255 family protein n=1 Tax=Singulisphaera acidiphila (strain ATCC BAA-1392 / DSM 18658 / VKM B-2454 / MOB10) TaxID=886293 RepID=L0DID6_SINAD|nr:TIGR04255 family protein [Singulisphaera acidiphila]AGA28396.1 hypothetical protein Sinac_4192 [Singulisphaera acidiphila DSM 18658]
MKLNNPPVIQSWIEFKFASGQEKPPWNLETAEEFLNRYEDRLPHQEAIIETTSQTRPFSGPQRSQRVSPKDKLDKAWARNDDQSHWLQIADDQMVYNQTRVESYLGFESLRDEALSKLGDYVDFFRPETLKSVELHYVDLIEIPTPVEQKIELQDYFHLRVEMPDEFGLVWHFSNQIFVKPKTKEDNNVLEVKFQSVRPDEEAGTYRFRLDWHFICLHLESWSRDIVCGRLDQAHTCLLNYFRASVTEKTWQLFQPSDEG